MVAPRGILRLYGGDMAVIVWLNGGEIVVEWL